MVKKKWQSAKNQGELSGTTGKSLKLEAIQINIKSETAGGIEYSVGEVKKSFAAAKTSGQTAGGKGKSLARIRMNLTGELAEKYDTDILTMTGFLDGINDSLKEPNPIEEMDEETKVNLGFDLELLYKNMVAADADWLYQLEQWNDIFDEEKRKALYKEQKSSTTVRKEAKIYPNDPCPCGSGKKYKKCCGRNA
jgi:preprotein translocase subunit SecA